MTQARHGTITRYNGGCRCEDCREGMRTYNRLYRARKKSGVKPEPQKKVVQMPRVVLDAPHEPGGNETALLAQLELWESTVAAQPALVQAAMALARILDDRTLVSLHAQSVRQYRETLAELRKCVDSRRGKLASVRQIRGGKAAAAG